MGCTRNFPDMVYSAHRIPSKEAVAMHQRLASLIRNKTKREYSELCGFVTARMLLVVVRSNTLILCGARDKEAYICQRHDLADGSVMALIAPCIR